MERNNKIIIITDSVSMPRPGIKYEDTWISMLKKNFISYDIMDRSARGSTSKRLVSEGGGGADLLETYMPAVVILQIGITECAPRLFKKKGFENFLMRRIIPPRLIPDYIRYVKRKRGRNPELTEIPPHEYRMNILNFADRCNKINCRLLIIKILKPTSLYISKSPHVKQNIDLYNSITDEIALKYNCINVIDPLSEINNIDNLCVDELHINKEGHIIYYQKITEALNLIRPT